MNRDSEAAESSAVEEGYTPTLNRAARRSRMLIAGSTRKSPSGKKPKCGRNRHRDLREHPVTGLRWCNSCGMVWMKPKAERDECDHSWAVFVKATKNKPSPVFCQKCGTRHPDNAFGVPTKEG